VQEDDEAVGRAGGGGAFGAGECGHGSWFSGFGSADIDPGIAGPRTSGQVSELGRLPSHCIQTK
jgi:hypothetical protein